MMRSLARLIANRRGVAAVEFAVFLPIFMLLFAGMYDIGSVLFTRFRLNAAVAAGGNYSIIRAADVNKAGGPALASNLVAIVRSNNGANYADTAVVVNNGPAASAPYNGAVTTSGTADNANLCYCPSTATTFSWGNSIVCGSPCPGAGANGLRAGRYVRITATRSYTPLFSSYGIVQNGALSVATMVRTG